MSRAVTSKSTVAPWLKGRKTTTWRGVRPTSVEGAVAEFLDDAGVRVDRDHGRLVEEDAALAGRKTRVRGPNVQRDV